MFDTVSALDLCQKSVTISISIIWPHGSIHMCRSMADPWLTLRNRAPQVSINVSTIKKYDDNDNDNNNDITIIIIIITITIIMI